MPRKKIKIFIQCSNSGCQNEALDPLSMAKRDRHLTLCRDCYMPDKITDEERCEAYTARNLSGIAQAARESSSSGWGGFPSSEDKKRATRAMKRSGIKTLHYDGRMTNNQKSASVWLAYIEGWRVAFSKDKRKMPTATDDVFNRQETGISGRI